MVQVIVASVLPAATWTLDITGGVSSYAKTDVTLLSESKTIETGFVLPDTSPDHSKNSHPVSASAVIVTTLPWTYLPPGGFRVTLPEPLVLSVRSYSISGILLKDAFTRTLPFMVTATGETLPLTFPLQPSNCHPDSGTAVISTTVPAL